MHDAALWGRNPECRFSVFQAALVASFVVVPRSEDVIASMPVVEELVGMGLIAEDYIVEEVAVEYFEAAGVLETVVRTVEAIAQSDEVDNVAEAIGHWGTAFGSAPAILAVPELADFEDHFRSRMMHLHRQTES